MIAAAALLLAIATPALAQTNVRDPSVSYAACLATRPDGLEASVPYQTTIQCDEHCRGLGYLYSFYIFDNPDDCSCRLYGPTPAEWRGSPNSALICEDGFYSVDITATTYQAPTCWAGLPDLNQGSVEGGPSQANPVSVITRVSDHGACLRQCVNWFGASVRPDGDAYTCQCDDGAGGYPQGEPVDCSTSSILRFPHGAGDYTDAAPPGQSIWAKRSLREQIRLDAQREAGKLCPNTARACLTSPGAVAYECIETDDELESCGGCLYGEFGQASSLMSAAKDCSAIEGVRLGGATCTGGRCVVSACDEGYSLVGNSCSAVSTPPHAVKVGLFSFTE